MIHFLGGGSATHVSLSDESAPAAGHADALYKKHTVVSCRTRAGDDGNDDASKVLNKLLDADESLIHSSFLLATEVQIANKISNY